MSSVNSPPIVKNKQLSAWRLIPRTPHDDFSIVLKQQIAVKLKYNFQYKEMRLPRRCLDRSRRQRVANWAQNVSTVATEYFHVAIALASKLILETSKEALSKAGHVKINGEVRRGVSTLNDKKTNDTLKSAVNSRERAIAFIHKLGKYVVALIMFVERKVPRYLHYNCFVTTVREYKRAIPPCFCCGLVDNRAQLFPTRAKTLRLLQARSDCHRRRRNSPTGMQGNLPRLRGRPPYGLSSMERKI